ncbi:MAG TPA: FAD-dependent thymidylate synthase [Thermoplasmata archaeon]|nr:FAD-dependent thymidylate synthase [Thermoplasmata archaeon]
MKQVKPVVIKIGETIVHQDAMRKALETIGASSGAQDRFLTTRGTDGQALIEFAGRICYESYEPGLNPNVTRIREDPADYYKNVIMKGDGSILEHGWCSFAILNVSRVCTHEIVRHRVGTAISQESLRYVRPQEIKFWIPDELSAESRKAMEEALEASEQAYRDLEKKVPWEKLSMDAKKRITSALRRILPDGLATNMVWTANHRTLRWTIEMRTDPAAEVEIRMVFDQIAEICIRDYPYLYGDFVATSLPDGTKSFRPQWRSKV